MPVNETLRLMNRISILIKHLILIVVSCAAFQNALSESFRYIDESGNIFFVDSIAEVPPKYRIQVVPPTPTPSLTRKQAAIYQQQLKRLNQQKEKERKKREKELALERKRAAKKESELKPGKRAIGMGGSTNEHKKVIPLFFTSPNCPECNRQEAFLTNNKIRFIKHDIVQSSVSFQLFDSLDVGSELPVMKFGKTIVKGFNPQAILAAHQGKTIATKPETLTTAPNNPLDANAAQSSAAPENDEVAPQAPEQSDTAADQ